MTSIANLPPLSTLTNEIILPVVDLSDGIGRTKQMTLGQLKTLSVGPRGVTGPIGPSGPSGPPANQALNTTSSVLFESVTVNSGVEFSDGSVQFSALSTPVQILEFASGNISLSKSQITGKILSATPPTNNLTIFIPASQTMGGYHLIIRNNSTNHSFAVQGGTTPIVTVNTSSAVQIACDSVSWFTI